MEPISAGVRQVVETALDPTAIVVGDVSPCLPSWLKTFDDAYRNGEPVNLSPNAAACLYHVLLVAKARTERLVKERDSTRPDEGRKKGASMDYAKLIALLVSLRAHIVAKQWVASAADANAIIGLILAAWLAIPPAPAEHLHAAMFARAPLTMDAATAEIDAHIEDAKTAGKIDLKSLFAMLVQLLASLLVQPA